MGSVARRIPWSAAVPIGAATFGIVAGVRAGLARGPSYGKLAFLIDAVLPVALGAATWVLVALRPALRVRLTALVVSLAVGLFAVELILRAVFPAEYPDYFERSRAARAAGIEFDKRSQVEVVLDLRRGGERAFPIATPASVLVLAENGLFKSALTVGGRETIPFGGVARARTLGANESGKQAAFVSDEMGFNNPPGLWGTGPMDIVLLGDSFTAGWGVNPEHNIATPIRARWPRTLNLGLTGAGPLLELGDLREFGAELAPKLVLWLYYEGNDLLDLQRERRTLLWGYMTPGFTQNLWARREEVDRALAAYLDRRIAAADRWYAAPIEVLQLKRVRALRKGRSERYVPGKADFDRLARVLSEAKKAAAAWGGQVWFVYLPTWARFAKPAEVPALDADRAEVLAMARAEGMPVIDIADVFRANGAPLDNFPYQLHGHYNERGYGLIGRTVADRIAASGFVGR